MHEKKYNTFKSYDVTNQTSKIPVGDIKIYVPTQFYAKSVDITGRSRANRSMFLSEGYSYQRQPESTEDRIRREARAKLVYRENV
jgi:hypothetical protein